MSKNKKQTDQKQTQSANSRPTIGLFLHSLKDKTCYALWHGIIDAARERDVNLMALMPNDLDAPTGFEAQANVLYNMISAEQVDGLLIWTAPIMNAGGKAGIKRIFSQYRSMPIVAIEEGGPEDVPRVTIDCRASMRAAVAHLIKAHGHRRIAFIRGPNETHIGARQRYQGYQDALSDFDLPLDPDLISPSTEGLWAPEVGEAAISLFLDERSVEFDAVVAVSDAIALNAMQALQTRGFHIPNEVAMVGFDDIDASDCASPPLTTVPMQSYQQGWQAVETLLTLLEYGEAPPEVKVPLEPILRQSCGCVSPNVAQAAAGSVTIRKKQFKAFTRVQQDRILAEMHQAASNTVVNLPFEWANELLTAFSDEITTAATGTFLPTLDTILRQVVAGNGPVESWQNVVSAFRRSALPYLANNRDLQRAEDLWLQAQVMIGEITQLTRKAQGLHAENQTRTLNEIGGALITTFNLEELMRVLAQELPRLGIPGCYLSLYENPQQPTEQSRLILAYDERGRLESQANERVFASTWLVPPEVLPQKRRYSYVVEPLYFRDEQLGFVLFEEGPRRGMIYDVLREQLSSALKGALLVEQEEKRARQLQTVAQVSTATATILDTADLLQKVVDLTKERFGLYHAHIYLLNDPSPTSSLAGGEEGRALVLAAGAGEAGRKMVSEGWRIPLGREQSLVARAARTGQVVIVENVRLSNDWLPNPLLPDTYAEMAVPIMLKDNVVGVLDVQSDKIGGLNEGDANLLRSLANHVAVTMTNARLFEETTRSKEAAELAQQEAELAREAAELAQREIEIANKTLEVQMWQTTGQAELNDKMRGEQELAALADNIIRQLCHYLQAQIGALYLAQAQTLTVIGTYAYNNKQPTPQFRFGQGLVGQAAVEKKLMLITNVPDDYITISSGWGETTPRHILIFPFMVEGQVGGVVELGTLTEFSQTQLEFMETALDSIAIAFNTAQSRARINELLSETQQQAEELQVQGEELRVANEELQAQTESLRISETQLKEKQTQLETTNTQLEEKAAALQESSTALKEKQAILDQQNRELLVAQQELERKAKELALASKYKSEFLANMSHELRTPLNSLLILARMLADNKDGNLSGDQVESAQIIYSGGTDLLNLINDILDLSKVEAGQMIFNFEAMPLTDLVSSMRLQFDPVAEQKGVVFRVNLAEDLPGRIHTDPQRVKQIVKNLLSNAFKFTKEGSVSLRLYRPADTVDLARSGLDPSRAIAINVADTGIGMTPEQLQVIFEAFQQADGGTSRQYGGTGLGLSISRELAANLGGQIEVESQSGRGSTFTLYLPLEMLAAKEKETAREASPPAQRQETLVPKPAASPQPAAPPVAQSAPPGDDRAELSGETQQTEAVKILAIIEDDPHFAKVVYNYAHKKGFKCLIAGEGKTGLGLVQSYQPEAIILDLNLPDMSGWEVLATLKNDPETRHIPVHIMSVDDEVLDAYRRGAMGYLTKPVQQESLDAAFDKIEGLISRNIKSLLLVEDDANSRLSIKKLLDGSDVHISEAGLGQVALELLETQTFDCMILDLSLPDMSGFEVLNKMNQNGTMARCPVIIYTGRELTPEENEELMRYADSVIVKGVKSPERLLDETALFLHRVVADMPREKQQTIKQLYNQDDLLKDKRILIVDDDMRNSFALSKLLSDKGIVPKIARDGQKALDLLAEGEAVDLVLMDIMMPVLDGYETIQQIRAQRKFSNLPILALTAKAMKGDREKCLAAGANDYLPKPVDVDRLFSMLRVWLYQ